MNWLINIFRKWTGNCRIKELEANCRIKSNTIEQLRRHVLPPRIPTRLPWSFQDRASLEQFLSTNTGRKLIGNMAHRIYEFHLDACSSATDSAVKNSYVRAANDNLSMLMYLASTDAVPEQISRSPLAKGENTTASDLRESDPLNSRV